MTTLVEAEPGSGIMIPQQFAFKPNQGGIRAMRTVGGWILVNLNKEMKQIRFSSEHIDWLINKFPHLAEILVRNGETVRRAQAMESRLRAIMNNPNVINLESIDPHRPNLSGFDAKDSTTIVRGVTYVDMGMHPPVRRFLFSEFEVKPFRVDEAAVQYALSGVELEEAKSGKLGRFLTDADLQGIKEGKSLVQLGKLRDAEDLRVHVLDLNRLIGGDAMVKHFAKLIETKKALLADLVTKFGLVPKGVISLSLREVYLEAPSIFKDDAPSKVPMEKVSRQGTSTAQGVKSPPVNELRVKVTVTPTPTGAIVEAIPNTTVRRFMDVDPTDLKRLEKAADEFLPKVAEAFAKVK